VIPIPRCRLLVTPTGGRLADALPASTRVAAGDVVATVSTASGEHELTAPTAGVVGGTLVASSHQLDAGDGVVWLDVA
jgi:biotin carboxyl carrier protein